MSRYWVAIGRSLIRFSSSARSPVVSGLATSGSARLASAYVCEMLSWLRSAQVNAQLGDGTGNPIRKPVTVLPAGSAVMRVATTETGKSSFAY
ncbi:hypothetical protein [Streptomyces sp. NPDC002540]